MVRDECHLIIVAAMLFVGWLMPEVQAAEMQTSDGVFSRGDTYCEILWGKPPHFTVSWNGTGGYCPDSPGFYNITEADVQATHGADQAPGIIWNGIRVWTLDAFIPQEGGPSAPDRTEQTVYEYGSMYPDGSGFIMLKQATVTVSGSFYDPPSPVVRFQTAFFKSGTKVYELVAPGCTNVYTMQSYMIGRPGSFAVQSNEELETLGERLNLPEGWTYRTRVLSDDLYIYGVNGTTPVLRDILGNSYSQHDSPLREGLCEISPEATSSSTAKAGIGCGATSVIFFLLWSYL